MSAAERVASILEEKFLQTGGLTTTLHRTGQQWDAPNGWAPLQWMAYQGLLHYDFQHLAAEVRRRWLDTCEDTYRDTGKMMEKYNVFGEGGAGGGGEYPNQDGFGWTNGVFLGMS
jgi:alpha,alpha-trehalase